MSNYLKYFVANNMKLYYIKSVILLLLSLICITTYRYNQNYVLRIGPHNLTAGKISYLCVQMSDS
jgi:hypothetical protein